jgi:hypothetical protein
MEELAARLVQIPGVVAVTLGGSRASGTQHDDSDWDFGLYYRGRIEAEHVRALGFDGTVVEPGEWGRLMNGGAWLTIGGQRVDLLYRELEFVLHWTREAEQGRWQRDPVEGYVAGMPTYALAGELALGRVLAGEELPRPSFPDALRRTAPPRWHASAEFSLFKAYKAASRGDGTYCAGLLAQAVLAAAHARLAERGKWVLNEKGLASRAGLAAAADLIAANDAAGVHALLEDLGWRAGTDLPH